MMQPFFTGRYKDKKSISKYYRFAGKSPQEPFCLAPGNALYFAHSGKILACCFNRYHLLGTYPGSKVGDVLKSEPANKLRSALSKNDLSLGCHFCREQVNAGNFTGTGASYYDHFPVLDPGPAVMHFELSNTCNLECIMCLGQNSAKVRKARLGLDSLPDVYDERFVEEISPLLVSLKEARFFGGEPFVIPIYEKIWEAIFRQNPDCLISVQTNATVWNKKTEDLLQKGRFSIGVSVDSLVPETYEKIRRGASFETMLSNLHKFREYCRSKNTFFGVATCPVRANLKELPALLDAFNKLDVPVHFNVVWVPLSQAVWTLPSATLKDLMDFFNGITLPGTGIIEKQNLQTWEGFLSNMKHWIIRAAKREAIHRKVAGEKVSEQLLFYKKRILKNLKGMPSNAIRSENKMQDLPARLQLIAETVPGQAEQAAAFRWLDAFPAEVLAESLIAYDDDTFREIALDIARNFRVEDPA